MRKDINVKYQAKKITDDITRAEFLPFPVAQIMLAPAMLTAEGTVFRAVLTLSFFIGCQDASHYLTNGRTAQT